MAMPSDNLLRDICAAAHDIAMGKYTTYTDLLAHLIRKAAPFDGATSGAPGHRFTLDIGPCFAGHYELIATDAHDGKRYRITVEPVTP